MKKIVLILVLIGLFACSDDIPTEPTKDYPIFHKNLAQDLAIKINQNRMLKGFNEFIYLTGVEYVKDGQTFNFDSETSKYPDYKFVYYPNYEIVYSETDSLIIFIRRQAIYLENTDNLIDSLANREWHLTENSGDTQQFKISFNIIEKENMIPSRFDDTGRENLNFGLDLIDLYIYTEITPLQ